METARRSRHPLLPVALHTLGIRSAHTRQLVRAYQSASQGSKQFNTRLVELVALAIHQLAVQVFKMKLNLHHHGDVDSVVFWVRPKPADWEGDWHEIPPRPTIFNHPGFHEHDIYPEAEADMVGYWVRGAFTTASAGLRSAHADSIRRAQVEDRILGGVPAFDRKAEAESSSAPPNIYFHACRRNVTQRIFQLRDDQQQALTRLLLADSAPGLCPLLILGDKQNHVRIDAHEAIIRHQVYRDLWERTPWTREEERRFKRRPKAEIDYPQMREMMESINSLPLSAERIEFSESGIPLEPLPENARFSTPGTQNEESEAQGNMSEAEVEVRASGSVRGKDPAERERSQDTSGFTEAKAEEPASKGPPSKGTSDTALDKGPRGGNGPQEAITSAETEAADSTAFTGGEALDKGSAVDALGYKSETYSEAGSSDSMSGEGRGGKRRRLN